MVYFFKKNKYSIYIYISGEFLLRPLPFHSLFFGGRMSSYEACYWPTASSNPFSSAVHGSIITFVVSWAAEQLDGAKPCVFADVFA